MTIHGAVGKRYGVSQDFIEKLIALEKSDFEYKEWLALKYARDMALMNGNSPENEDMHAFTSMYSQKERNYILKIIRLMIFSNCINNSLTKQSWRADLEGLAISDPAEKIDYGRGVGTR
jgi:hypothetical protein